MPEYLDMLKQIHELGDVTVSFDVGWDMTGVWYEGIFELLPMIDVLFMNETECLHYTRRDTVAGRSAAAGSACGHGGYQAGQHRIAGSSGWRQHVHAGV